jgi:hypothetical protein
MSDQHHSLMRQRFLQGNSAVFSGLAGWLAVGHLGLRRRFERDVDLVDAEKVGLGAPCSQAQGTDLPGIVFQGFEVRVRVLRACGRRRRMMSPEPIGESF